MYSPIVISAYVSILISNGVKHPLPPSKVYAPYTTNIVIRNHDMYDVNKIMTDLLEKEVEQEKNDK